MSHVLEAYIFSLLAYKRASVITGSGVDIRTWSDETFLCALSYTEAAIRTEGSLAMSSAYLSYTAALYITQSIVAGHSQINGHVALVLPIKK